MASLKKSVWLINPAAIPPQYEVRIQTLKRAQYLIENGYNVFILGGSFLHNTSINLITDDKSYLIKDYDGIKYIHIRNSCYSSNNYKRIVSMIEFFVRLWFYAREFPKPDYICTHSAIPFGAISYFVSRKVKARFIVDVVDLWPESFVAYKLVSKYNLFVKLSYIIEHWLYTKAEVLIFSMEGGRDYILEKGWSIGQGGGIDINKVYYINNGVDLTDFEYNSINYRIEDTDLQNDSTFKVIYIGSIRLANNLRRLIDAAQILEKHDRIKILIYGDGEERDLLERYCVENGITNVLFKQKWVELKYVPYILSRSSLNILNYMPSPLFRFGGSQTKSFQYMASGKPICANVDMNYCPIKKYEIGVAQSFDSAQSYAESILYFYQLANDKYNLMCQNAKNAAVDYDYRKLTEKFIAILNTLK